MMDTASAENETAQLARSETAQPTEAARPSARRRWLALTAVVCGIAGGAYAAYWHQVLRFHESTDDAYVDGNVVQITPQISGTVVSIGADDTQFVTAGQPLVKLDPADARLALDETEARLAKTVRQVRTLFATSGQLAATVTIRERELARADEDLGRRQRLAASGAVSQEEVQHAIEAQRSAQAALAAAQKQYEANRALVDGTTVNNHPDVRDAATQVRDAYLTYARTVLPAPVSGFVAKRAVQVGQRVAPGTALMAVVPLDQVWIDANFREPQLASMRVGQRVELRSDLYGKAITYHGAVVGFGAGTGSAFALLPAQNATGNWIKIVQRLPVRIAIDAGELAAHPLQIGLSMKVTVDTRDRGGARLPQVARAAADSYTTSVFASADATATQRVREIIVANDAGGTSGAASIQPGNGTPADARGAGVAADARRAGPADARAAGTEEQPAPAQPSRKRPALATR